MTTAPDADAGLVIPAEQTLERMLPLQTAMGVTRLADLTGLDRIGVPVFAAIRPNSRSAATSQGKGLTAPAARAAALMEAAETWHAERVELPLRFATAADLEGRHINLARLPMRDGRAFDPNLPILWVAGVDLGSRAAVWLPYELVHTDYRLPEPPAARCFHISTNGLAAGNSLAEAQRHALCELIERDCLALWNSVAPPMRADPAGVPVLAALEARLVAAGFAVGLFDIGGRLGLPAYGAVLVDREMPTTHPGFGSACHPIARVAAVKALLEAIQVRTSYVAGAWDEFAPEEYTGSGIAEKIDWAESLLAHAGARVPIRQDAADVPREAAPQVLCLLDRLAGAGMTEVVMVDLTRAAVGVPVVRLLVPGLMFEAGDAAVSAGSRH